MMLYLIRFITDITCRPGTCGKWDSNSPFVVDDDDDDDDAVNDKEYD